MGATNLSAFSAADIQLAQYAKALAHPARVAILQFLLKKEACMCGDIVNELPLSQSTVSQHLKELKEAGLITGEIEGTKVCYCIDAKEWAKAQQAVARLFARYDPGKQCC